MHWMKHRMPRTKLPTPSEQETDLLDEVLGEIGEQIDDIGEHIESAALGFATGGNPKLERAGMRYFTRRAKKMGQVHAGDAIHVLNVDELRQLRRAVWTAIGLAAAVGFLAGVASGLAEVMAQPLHGGPDVPFFDNWRYHLLVQGVTIGATIVEIYALYAIGLRAAHDLAHLAGFSLERADDPSASETEKDVALALARAAFELPNPPENTFGVNPYRAMATWQVFFKVLAYKLKITVTTFIVRTLVARASTRASVRSWLAFVSAPITGLWDGAAMWVVLRQVRLRVLGNSAVFEILRAIEAAHPALSTEAKVAMARAVAAAIVFSGELHPNHSALMKLLPVDPTQIDDLDDPALLERALQALSTGERQAVLEVLTMAILIDGRLARKERQLWQRLAAQNKLAPSQARLREVARRFAGGRPWSRQDLVRALKGSESPHESV